MKKYSSDMALKYKFPGLESVIQNYSQTFQDIFVLTMLNGKRGGTFLEIGGFDPFDISNTYLLESVFGWHGISVELDGWRAGRIRQNRTCTVINENALTIDYTKALANYPQQIDYLQIDIEPAMHSLECLKLLPLTTYRFSVITFEHEFFRGEEEKQVRVSSRQIFNAYGYTLIAGNISNQSHEDIYEDWWVDPQVIDPVLIKMFKHDKDINMPGDEFMEA
jgi:hypothetical protein